MSVVEIELDVCTDEDTVDEWLAKQPAPPFVPSTLRNFVVPKLPWTIECDGFPFPSLTAAEIYADKAKARGEHTVIHCRLALKKEPS